MSAFIPRLIVGLGNPKTSYDSTRHNVGKRFIQYLAQGVPTIHHTRQAQFFLLPFGKFGAITGCVLMSYMNESGPPLKRVLHAENVNPSEILVVLDDFMIPFGSVRLRSDGSAGGHNGLQSVIQALGTEDFGRLRIGIGPVPAGKDPAEFVLESFKEPENDSLEDIFKFLHEGLLVLFKEGYQRAMTVLNKQLLLGYEK